MMLTIALVIGVLATNASAQPADPAPWSHEAKYVGTMLSRPGLYDLKPKVLYRNGVFEFYELGQYRTGDTDITSPDRHELSAGDRIYSGVAATLNGEFTEWAERPRVVYRGLGGTTGRPECDDHLVGSPTRIGIGGDQFMLVEAYGNWCTRLVRNWSIVNLDTWTTASETDLAGNLPDSDWSYAVETGVDLGFAPRFKTAGTHPVYSCEVWYWFGKRNRFLSRDPVPWRVDASGIWRTLNAELPVFFLYDTPSNERVEIRQFWQSYFSNTFISTSRADDGGVWGCVPTGPSLGYAAKSLRTRDTSGCLLNRIRLLRLNSDGKWVAVDGSATGQAMLSPSRELVAEWPHASTNPLERLSPSRYYGCGYPLVLVRENVVEIYFTDDTRFGRPRESTELTRITLSKTDFTNPTAWLNASQNAQQCRYYLSDIKWSPRFSRYFAYSVKNGKPELRWSPRNPPANEPPTFPEENAILIDLPTGLTAGWGGLSGNELGHLDERPGYTPVHIVFEQFSNGNLADTNSEIGHAVVFLWDPVK